MGHTALKFFNEAQLDDRLEYQHTYNKRDEGVKKILARLNEAGQISVDVEDSRFLLSFLTLFGRFGIIEAFMLDKNRREEEILNHYLTMLAHQMSMFVTPSGKKSINKFRQKHLKEI